MHTGSQCVCTCSKCVHTGWTCCARACSNCAHMPAMHVHSFKVSVAHFNVCVRLRDACAGAFTSSRINAALTPPHHHHPFPMETAHYATLVHARDLGRQAALNAARTSSCTARAKAAPATQPINPHERRMATPAHTISRITPRPNQHDLSPSHPHTPPPRTPQTTHRHERQPTLNDPHPHNFPEKFKTHYMPNQIP